MYLHKSISKVDPIPKISAGKMAIERGRVELGQHEDLVDATVETIAHRDVYKPVAPTYWDLQKQLSPLEKLRTQNTNSVPISLFLRQPQKLQNNLFLDLMMWKEHISSNEVKIFLTAGVAALLVRGNS